MSGIGTKIVQTDDPRERDVQFGVLFKVVAWSAGILAAIFATIFAAGMLRLFEMSADMEVLKARQMLVLERLNRIESLDYVTRSEIYSWLSSNERLHTVRSMSNYQDPNEAISKEIQRLEEDKKAQGK